MLSEPATEWLAIGVLTMLVVALMAWYASLFRCQTFSFAQFPVYLLCMAMTRVLWRAKIEGRVPFGPGEGAVIVCNHIGPVDPFFIALACGRQVHWMVAREYVESKLLGGFLRLAEVIPVNRGGIDTASTKLAVRYAKDGDMVGLFPEGRINETRKRFMLPGRPGAALIALKARVPVVPCYLSGCPNDGTAFGALFMAAKAHLKVGQPIDITPYLEREDDKELLETLTKVLMVEIAKLAGEADFQPEVAGRNWRCAAIVE